MQIFGSDLTYLEGATVLWELGASTETNAPVVFDQIGVGGNLTFGGATLLTLSFNPTTVVGTVDWSDAFWLQARQWTVYDVTGSTTGFGNLTVVTETWLDAQGDGLGVARPYASFSLQQVGSDVILAYTPVPEPSAYGLTLGGLALALAAKRRRRGQALT